LPPTSPVEEGRRKRGKSKARSVFGKEGGGRGCGGAAVSDMRFSGKKGEEERGPSTNRRGEKGKGKTQEGGEVSLPTNIFNREKKKILSIFGVPANPFSKGHVFSYFS